MGRGIRAIMIVEIAGRPANHLSESLKAHIAQLKNRKNLVLISESYSEPKRLEETEQEFYTCFAEVEVETPNFFEMINLIFDFMPSSFEIIAPQEINLNLSDATTILNTLSGRLHKYDEIAKVAQFQVQKLAHQLNQMQKQDSPALEEKKEEKKAGKKKKKK